MNRRFGSSGRLMLAVLALLLIGSAALAQSGGGYDLSWSTVDAGGLSFAGGGSYVLGATAGQPDAGQLSSGDYVLGGGYWGGGALVRPVRGVYLPVVVRDRP